MNYFMFYRIMKNISEEYMFIKRQRIARMFNLQQKNQNKNRLVC